MKYYQGEVFGFKFLFSELDPNVNDVYVYTEPGTTGYIASANFDFSDGNRQVDPLGSMCSSRLYIKGYDGEDNFNPFNEDSPYFGLMKAGLRVDARLYLGNGLRDYGIWYVTSWTNNYEGAPGFYNISLEDRLNKIGSTELTDTTDDTDDNDWYTGQSVADALKFIFEDICSLSSIEYVIEDNLGSIAYASISPGPARNVLNDICHKCLACLFIGHDRKIYLRSVLKTGTADYQLIGADIGPITTAQSDCNDISTVEVDYPDKDSLTYAKVAELNTAKLKKATAGYSKFKLKCDVATQSIEDVVVDVNFDANTSANIDAISYNGNVKKLKVKVTPNAAAFSGDYETAQYDVDIQVYGTKTSDAVRKIAEYDINEDDGRTLTYISSTAYDSDAIAEEVAENIGHYIEGLQKAINVTANQLTPDVNVGDIIEFYNETGDDSIPSYYLGKYVVSQFSVEVGQTYTTSLLLYKAVEEE